MGVAGCGKTTIGRLLADALHLEFFDADDFHPAGNLAKMANGQALTDDDRAPWLAGLGAGMRRWVATGGAVLACSALKAAYRCELLAAVANQAVFIYLKGDAGTLARRLSRREGHFFPAALLESQLTDLEEPDKAVTVWIEDPPAVICARVLRMLADIQAGNGHGSDDATL